MHLSKNFTLEELLCSSAAERHAEVKKEQHSPDKEVVNNLTYLCQKALQPVRDILNHSMRISSGYRCPSLNQMVGGSPNSQHVLGQAADCSLPAAFLDNAHTKQVRSYVADQVLSITGKPIRSDVNANFYLFAMVCLHLDELDIDQVIHEYGERFGRPAWIHLSASQTKDKRQILCLGKYNNGKVLYTVEEAMRFGN